MIDYLDRAEMCDRMANDYEKSARNLSGDDRTLYSDMAKSMKFAAEAWRDVKYMVDLQ